MAFHTTFVRNSLEPNGLARFEHIVQLVHSGTQYHLEGIPPRAFRAISRVNIFKNSVEFLEIKFEGPTILSLKFASKVNATEVQSMLI